MHLLFQEFDVISSSAKEFISSLLQKSPAKRLTASECLSHPWLSADGDDDDKEHEARINKANLRRFLARRRWQRCGQAIR